uniref:histidine kinase n=1 Tax=uncultured bacterium BLR19 TaxID=506519 RepID=C0INY5_9BACT|nr:two-component hybrid sensor and regulator [uncultured bacterium BLR19]
MKPKILLVDDREDNLLSIEAILAPSGYQFVKANSGREALKVLLTEFDFAMILMDVKMPNLNGFETASLIYEREKLKHIPIIFITANNYGDENMYKGYQSGAIDYIFKPINPDILRAKVGVLIDLYKKNRLLFEQEQKLKKINKNLEREVNERIISEEKVKMLNHKLLENIANLESANKELESFAFMASHDLQEPLRKIRMFSDRLFQKYKDAFQEDADLVSRIQKSAERMQTLIVDILTFSKISGDKSVFVASDLNTILNDLLAEMKEEVQENEAMISIDLIPPLYVSPTLMRPLFQNLISNALKYRRKDVKPKISIRSEVSSGIIEQDTNTVNKYCRIIIEDNGIGFHQKYAEEIFGMFRRLHKNGDYAGTGVGLALCKKITELHNGFISAQSKVDEGSTFIISLPLNRDN